jgi:hypothetical protein
MKKPILIVVISLFAATAYCQVHTAQPDTSRNIPLQSKTAFRMHPDQLYRQNADGSYSPKQPLMINGEMVPTSTRIANGVKYGGLDLMGGIHSDAMVDTLRGVIIIRRFVK